MSVAWTPKRLTIEDELSQEIGRIAALKAQRDAILTPPPAFMQTMPPVMEPVQQEPMGMTYAPPVIQPTPQPMVIPQMQQQVTRQQVATPEPKDERLEVPLWERALQVFGAPFNWVDENIIKPGLGLAGTALGVPESPRKEGEDFWEWKKRSWAEWDVPSLVKIPMPWADDGKWDIDFKGIMEFAPWLLIPGPAGIAGKVAKLGTGGRIAAKGIMYSPWGIAETVTKAGMKGLGAVGRLTDKAEQKVFGALPEKPPTPEHAMVLGRFLKEKVGPKYKEFKSTTPALRQRQEIAWDEAFNQAIREGKTPLQAGEIAHKALGGGEKQYYRVDASELKPYMDDLITDIHASQERGLIQADNVQALIRMFSGGELPQPHHIRDLSKIFGKEFANVVKDVKGVPLNRWEKIVDAFNAPRAVLSTYDISAVGRQGLIAGLMHPTKIPKATKEMIRAMASEKWALESESILRAMPEVQDLIKRGGTILSLAEDVGAAAMEEFFPSKLARLIPGVRRSERGFISYINWLKAGIYKDVKNSVDATVTNIAKKEDTLNSIVKLLDLATGRGQLPKSMTRYAPLFNAIAFSPRYQASIVELPFQLGKMLMSGNPYERKEAARALVTFVGGGVSLLTLLKQTKLANVELDMRSADFGKIRLKSGEDAQGNPIYSGTRYDVWRGYLQYIRFLTQFATGERKSAMGNMNKAERGDIALRFLQSKASPASGLLFDLWRNETYMGDPMFTDTTGFTKYAKDKFAPLALQDIMDAMEESGTNGAWSAIPAGLGIGTLTYVNDLVIVKNKIAKQMGKEKWGDIDPKTQVEIQNSNIELQTAMLEYDRRMMGTAWGDWRIAGNAIEDDFQKNVELAVNQYRETGDGVQFREKVGKAFDFRKGAYSAREGDERFVEIVRRQSSKDDAELLVTLGPEQLAIKTYNDALYGDDMYDEFGDYRFDEAEIRREALRNSMGQEMYDYVEEYKNEKYAILPQEYQLLAEAKIVMRPYLNVRNDIEKMFGKTFAESSAGQSLLTKVRKQKRMADPEIEKYYQMFYAQK